MAKIRDLVGERFGRLVVTRIEPIRSKEERRSFWVCTCDCGAETVKVSSVLVKGTAKSCGCLQKELAAARRTTHGLAVPGRQSRAFKAWYNAKLRCFSPKDKRYAQYGGRGITMCPEWRDDPHAFIRDMGECPPGLTLERIDSNGNYEPGNCRWATMDEQARNRTTNRYVEHDGYVMTMTEYAKARGVNYASLKRRAKVFREDLATAADAILAERQRRMTLPALRSERRKLARQG